jgi:hypothetical protein
MEVPIPILSVPNTLDTTKRSIQTTGPRPWIAVSKVCKAFTGVPTDTLQRRGRNFGFFIGFSRLLSLNQLESSPKQACLQGLS